MPAAARATAGVGGGSQRPEPAAARPCRRQAWQAGTAPPGTARLPTYVDVPKAPRPDLPAQPILALHTAALQAGRQQRRCRCGGGAGALGWACARPSVPFRRPDQAGQLGGLALEAGSAAGRPEGWGRPAGAAAPSTRVHRNPDVHGGGGAARGGLGTLVVFAGGRGAHTLQRWGPWPARGPVDETGGGQARRWAATGTRRDVGGGAGRGAPLRRARLVS